MKKFVLKCLLFAALFIAIAFPVQFIADRCLQNSNIIYYDVWNDMFNSKINADIIFMGPSRTRDHISPKVLDSTLFMNTYNLGCEAGLFPIELMKYDVYSHYNKKPKYILQNVDCTILYKGPLFELEQYIPYLHWDFALYKMISNYDVFSYRDLLIPLYKYTHSLNTKTYLLNGISNTFRKEKSKPYFSIYKNYVVFPGHFNMEEFQKQLKTLYVKPWPDSTVEKQFAAFLDRCKKDSIKVILIYTPEYIELQKAYTTKDSIVNLFQNYAQKYQIPFLDYSNDSINNDTAYFRNSEHLSKKGVVLFNKMLADDLKRIIIGNDTSNIPHLRH